MAACKTCTRGTPCTYPFRFEIRAGRTADRYLGFDTIVERARGQLPSTTPLTSKTRRGGTSLSFYPYTVNLLLVLRLLQLTHRRVLRRVRSRTCPIAPFVLCVARALPLRVRQLTRILRLGHLRYVNPVRLGFIPYWSPDLESSTTGKGSSLTVPTKKIHHVVVFPVPREHHSVNDVSTD